MADEIANNGTANNNTSGESNVQFDYSLKRESDCVSDANMAEIARRLQGFVASDQTGDVIFAPFPPNDTEKLWVETSSTGAIIGTIKRYDSATGNWVDDHFDEDDLPEVTQRYPKTYSEVKQTTSDPGAGELQTIDHNLSTDSYFYTITWLDFPEDDTRWWEISRTSDQLQIRIKDGTVHNGGGFIRYRVDVIEILTA